MCVCVCVCVYLCSFVCVCVHLCLLTLMPMVAMQQVKSPRDGQKKRKKTQSAGDEPESKVGKTESKDAPEPAKGINGGCLV